MQCSEADAHLILSEDNTAARLLTRPGEAIYNDANGLYEGNHPFQVVWLSDSERDDYLQHVRELAKQRHCATPPTIVFEGNVLADPRRQSEFERTVARGPNVAGKRTGRVGMAWLGRGDQGARRRRCSCGKTAAIC